MIKKIDIETLRNVYYQYMTKDFPENELKPFEMIEEIINRNKGTAIGFYQNNNLLGYAILIYSQDKLLLDYFAIIKEYRKKGYGTTILKEVKEYFKNYAFLLIESEDNNSLEAKERIKFYQHCGCKNSKTRIRLYFVDYLLLYLELSKNANNTEIKNEIFNIYKEIYPEYIDSEYLLFYK